MKNYCNRKGERREVKLGRTKESKELERKSWEERAFEGF